MTIDLFHTQLETARKLIAKKEFSKAYEVIDAHRKALAEDTAEEEQSFTELIVLVKEYSKQIDMAADYAVEMSAESAIRMLEEASETGKQIIEAAERMVKLLKKEEKDTV